MATTCVSCGKKKRLLTGADFERIEEKDYCGACAERFKREAFRRAMAPFIDEALVSEVYYNQYFSICCLADTVYGLFLYGAPTLSAVLIMPADFEHVTTSINEALAYVRRCTAEEDACVTLTERSVELLKAMKQETAARRPQEEADAASQLQAEWSARSGERIAGYTRKSDRGGKGRPS